MSGPLCFLERALCLPDRVLVGLAFQPSELEDEVAQAVGRSVEVSESGLEGSLEMGLGPCAGVPKGFTLEARIGQHSLDQSDVSIDRLSEAFDWEDQLQQVPGWEGRARRALDRDGLTPFRVGGEEEPSDRKVEPPGEGDDVVGGEPARPIGAKVRLLRGGPCGLAPPGTQEGLDTLSGFLLAEAPELPGPSQVVGHDLVRGLRVPGHGSTVA